jgi:hypothetical protein
MAAVNPAVGARGQIGLSQEGSWGSKQNVPTSFFEMLNETIVSELGSLVSNSLRPDRAVHKRIGGVESAGGDVNVEVSASGLGKLFKHALGSVVTTRLDHAFVLKVTNASTTSAVLTVTTAAGLATGFTVTMTGGGAGVDLTLSDADSDTIQEVMNKINAVGTGLAAYSVTSYQAAGDSTTIDASDYAVGTDNSNKLEEVTAVELIKNSSGNKDFLVSFGFGAYQHVIDAAATLPQGLTIEVGRDVAAFTYSGCKVNTMTLTADTGEIMAGTFGVLAKGATTASRAIAASGNTGNAKNAFSIRYTGEGATCTFTVDKTNHHISIDSATASEDLDLDISIPWTDPSTGIVYPVHTLGGLVAYLNNLSYITCTISDYAALDADCSTLVAAAGVDIDVTTAVVFDFDTADVVSEPVTWGDYYTGDAGTAVDLIAEIVDAGVPGAATIRFQASGGSWGDTYTTSATLPTEVRIASNVDTKFTIFFPDDTALQAGDSWTISSFKDEETASAYPTLDPFAGFDGALTIDGSAQGIMGWNCTLNNNLFPDKYHLGERVRGALPEQRRTVEGSVNVEFDNLDLYRRFLNGTAGNLVMVFTSDTYIADSVLGNSLTQYGLTIRQPNMEFNGTTPTVADEGIITVDMPYVAMYDDVNSIPELRVTLVNNSAYL